MRGVTDFCDQTIYLQPSRESADSIAGAKICNNKVDEVVF